MRNKEKTAKFMELQNYLDNDAFSFHKELTTRDREISEDAPEYENLKTALFKLIQGRTAYNHEHFVGKRSGDSGF